MIKLGKGITFGIVEDETLITNSETNQMIKLNKQGTELWKKFYKMSDITLVIEYYMVKYSDIKEKVKEDIVTFYNTLIERGVISNEEYKKI